MYVCLNVNRYIYTYMCVCMYASLYVYIYICMHVRMHVYVLYVSTYCLTFVQTVVMEGCDLAQSRIEDEWSLNLCVQHPRQPISGKIHKTINQQV